MDKKIGNKSKNKLKRIVGKVLIFCLVMLSFSDFSGVITYANTEKTVYFGNNGKQYASGTKKDPLATLEQALEKVQNGGIVKALGGSNESTSAVQGILATPSGKNITITSENMVEIPFRHNIVLQGDVTFENVKIKMGGTSSTGTNNRIVANGHHLHMGKGVTTLPYTEGELDLLPRLYAGGYGKNVQKGKITVESGEYSGIYAGGINTKNIVYGGGYPPSGYGSQGDDRPAKITGNVEINISDAKIRGKNEYPIISVSGEGAGSVIDGNTNIVLNNVDITNNDNKSTRIIKTNNVKKSTVTFDKTTGKIKEIAGIDDVIIKGGSTINNVYTRNFITNVENLTLESGSKIYLKSPSGNYMSIRGNFTGGGEIWIEQSAPKGNFKFDIGGTVKNETKLNVPQNKIMPSDIYFSAGSKDTDNAGFVLSNNYNDVYEIKENGQNPIEWKLNARLKKEVYVSNTGKEGAEGDSNSPVKTIEEAMSILNDNVEQNLGIATIKLKSDITIDKPLYIPKKVRIDGENKYEIKLNAPIVLKDSKQTNKLELYNLIIDVTNFPNKDLIDLNSTGARGIEINETTIKGGNININNMVNDTIVNEKLQTSVIIRSGNFDNINMGDSKDKAPYYNISVSQKGQVNNIDGGKTRPEDKIVPFMSGTLKTYATEFGFDSIGTKDNFNKVNTVKNITNLILGDRKENLGKAYVDIDTLLNTDNIEFFGPDNILKLNNNAKIKRLEVKGNNKDVNIILTNGKYLEVTEKLDDITLDIGKTNGDIKEGVYIIAPKGSNAKVTLSNNLKNQYRIDKKDIADNKVTYSVVKNTNTNTTITPKKIEITGDTNTVIQVGEDEVVRSFGAKVTDDSTKEIAAPVKFSLDTTVSGATITQTGQLVLDPKTLKEGNTTITIKAEVIDNTNIATTKTVTVNKLPKLKADKIVLTGVKEVKITDNNPIYIDYSARVYDEKGRYMPDEKVTFNTDNIEGVTIENKGNNTAIITIEPIKFKNGNINIIAKTTNNKTKTQDIKVEFEKSAPKNIGIDGDNEIELTGNEITKQYTSKVKDQFGKDLSNYDKDVTFKIGDNSPTGITINKNTGQLTISTNAKAGTLAIVAELEYENSPTTINTTGNKVKISSTKYVNIIDNTKPQTTTTTEGTTENTTEGTTENTTEGTTENTTEGTTEITTENITEGTTENITENTTEGTTEITTENITEGTTENTTEITTETTTENTTETTTRPPSSGGGGGSSSGGSSGGGGGGSSSRPKEPIIKDEPIFTETPQEKPTQSETPQQKPQTAQKEVEVKIEPTIENGKKTVDLSSEDGKKAINKISKSKTKVASIDLADENTELKAEVDDIKKILETKDLKVKNDIGEIVLNKNFSDNLQEDNNTINISLKDDKDGINVKIAVDDKDVKSAKNDYMLKINNIGKTDTMVPYIIDENGKEQIVKKSITLNGDIKMLLNASNKIKFKENKKVMKDTNSHWAKNNIDYVLSRELFRGTSKQDFSPNETMTRGMLVTVLHRLDNAKNKATSKFKDVPKGAYYKDPIDWAYENKIVSGTSDGRFLPEQNITREQLAVIISNYLEYANSDIKRSNFKQFTDFNDVSVWARDSIEDMVSYGLISGKTKDTINPKDTATRAEVSTIMSNLIGKMVE